MISAIETETVSKITSGQVIVELVSLVKELVDNSLDAGSDKIDIIFTDYGVSSIEVSDNGAGIESTDFETLCLKHHTSKLATFEDLADVSTLGFRGEAMSSLCAVASVSVETCTSESYPKATQLTYGLLGEIVKQKKVVTGKKGTTVTVKELFKSMPVRQKNLVKHSKREYLKLLQTLVGYFFAHPNVRFTVHHSRSGKKSMVFGTQGRSVLDAMVSVYGSNGKHGLVTVDLEMDKVRLKGCISDWSFGMGRGALDRQFLSVNQRPVTHKRLVKVINEVYRTFNTTQLPVFVLNLEIDSKLMDVNVTPDKRIVMLHSENRILEELREGLLQFYESQHNVVPKSELVVRVGTHRKEEVPGENGEDLEEGGEEQRKDEEEEENEEDGAEEEENEEDSEEDGGKNSPAPQYQVEVFQLPQELETAAVKRVIGPELDSEHGLNPEGEMENEGDSASNREEESAQENDSASENDDEENGDVDHLAELEEALEILEEDSSVKMEIASQVQSSDLNASEAKPLSTHKRQISDNGLPEAKKQTRARPENSIVPPSKRQEQPKRSQSGLYRLLCKLDLSSANVTENKAFNKDSDPGAAAALSGAYARTRPTDRAFNALVHDITQTLTIRKADFSAMHVVGQFNLGFIVVTHGTRLFIVDQHALDEIFNYERLRRTLILRAQPLVALRILELLPIDEMAVLDHVHELKKNGFIVEEDAEGAPGRRVRLVAVPVLKNVVFDDSDLHELVQKLHDSPTSESRNKQEGSYSDNNTSEPHTNGIADEDTAGPETGDRSTSDRTNQATLNEDAACDTGRAALKALRCTKADAMIALRACRLSIMVGQALTPGQMDSVVKHLSTLERPWNCPHGRPTMRHLADLEGAGFVDDYMV